MNALTFDFFSSQRLENGEYSKMGLIFEGGFCVWVRGGWAEIVI